MKLNSMITIILAALCADCEILSLFQTAWPALALASAILALCICIAVASNDTRLRRLSIVVAMATLFISGAFRLGVLFLFFKPPSSAGHSELYFLWLVPLILCAFGFLAVIWQSRRTHQPRLLALSSVVWAAALAGEILVLTSERF